MCPFSFVSVRNCAYGGGKSQSRASNGRRTTCTHRGAAIAAARRVVLLADSTKAGQEHFARFGSFADVGLLLTDTGLTPAHKAAIEAAGTEVVLV